MRSAYSAYAYRMRMGPKSNNLQLFIIFIYLSSFCSFSQKSQNHTSTSDVECLLSKQQFGRFSGPRRKFSNLGLPGRCPSIPPFFSPKNPKITPRFLLLNSYCKNSYLGSFPGPGENFQFLVCLGDFLLFPPFFFPKKQKITPRFLLLNSYCKNTYLGGFPGPGDFLFFFRCLSDVLYSSLLFCFAKTPK